MEEFHISIAIICYNHAEFISEAIDSVLNQKHSYKCEILVSDDASTDETVSILVNYQKQYPDLINVILQDTNIGPTQNLYQLLLQCKGKYIAILEGDDFWTDIFKIKKQVEFLDSNPSIIACTHRYKVVNEKGAEIVNEYFGLGRPLSGEYKLEHFENYIYSGLLGSLVFRNLYFHNRNIYEIVKSAHPFIGDITLNLLLLLNGRIFVMDDNMAAHRIIVRKNGSNYKSTVNGKNQIKNRLLYLEKLEKFALIEYNVSVRYAPRVENFLAWSILYLVKYPNKHNWSVMVFVFKLLDDRKKFINYILLNINKIPKFIFSQIIKFFKK
ncbi:glycosyltransferase [Aquirufa sp. KTFRIE-69F]|uniref:Glycosyltransferase n=1 Tax=Aquirufa originis TaxID=3096514 RepID=A0ABW6D9B5_9BACT